MATAEPMNRDDVTGTPKEGNRELQTGTQTASSGHIVPTGHSYADLNNFKRELVQLATEGTASGNPPRCHETCGIQEQCLKYEVTRAMRLWKHAQIDRKSNKYRESVSKFNEQRSFVREGGNSRKISSEHEGHGRPFPFLPVKDKPGGRREPTPCNSDDGRREPASRTRNDGREPVARN
jgi:hypothetical protein